MSSKISFFAAIALSLYACGTMAAGVPIAIPLKPDPPFAIDGDLADWASVPNAIKVADRAQVVWDTQAWKSPEDLSGTVTLAWREEHLYVAANVTDDTLVTQRGQGLWKGDNVTLYIDARPDAEPSRDSLGEGQYRVALSPGNFSDYPPEAWCHAPDGCRPGGILVGAKRTETGWMIEAAIPWRLLRVDAPKAGLPLRVEVCISDTDGEAREPESFMTTSTAAWAETRSRMNAAVLAGADGVAPAAEQAADVFSQLQVAPGQKAALTFDAPAAPSGRVPVLTFRGRLAFNVVAGFAPAMRVSVNGAALDAGRLLNKPLRVKARGGDVYSMAAGDRLSTYYSPDFDKPDLDPHYGLTGGYKACDFDLSLEGLLKEGPNELLFEHVAPETKCDLIVAEGKLAFRPPKTAEKAKAGPPTGPLETWVPLPELKTAFTARQPAGNIIELEVAGEKFDVESKFSTPAGIWASGSSDFFSFERKIEQKSEAVIVRDTFTNLTEQNLPLMRRNSVDLAGRIQRLWLAGLEQGAKAGSQSNPCNPTTFAATEAHGIGLMPLDDVARIHTLNSCAESAPILGDNNLVLRPHAVYTAEWAIIPTDKPDYWKFINAARRLIDANFTIDGAFAFLRADPITDAWTDAQIADFIRYKDARYVCSSISYPMYKGRYTHGTSFQMVPLDNFRNSFQRWRGLGLDAKYLVYFHCFIDVTDEGPERFQDARLLQPDGTQADYGMPYDRIYFPTEGNSYGREVGKNVDLIFDTIGADGVYWDEHEYSRYQFHYGEPWDGFTGDIDASKMTLSRLKSSVTLLTEPWRLALARKIMARGPLIGNGPPFTRAMAALKFPCFVETGSITNCAQAHLHSPIALGDHLTERSEVDAYRTMLAALDYGCVYHWYNDVTVIPTHPHLTRYMYPITPMELHEGYIIGRERIVTKISGRFGWGDESRHEVHVFDDTGTELQTFGAPFVREDGKTLTELRLPQDYAAVIIRIMPK
jgi:hypothetical protein